MSMSVGRDVEKHRFVYLCAYFLAGPNGYGRCFIGRDAPVNSVADVEAMEASILANNPERGAACIVSYQVVSEHSPTTARRGGGMG